MHDITIQKKEYLTDTILLLTTTKPKNFTYTSGQFVQCYIPANSKAKLRSYSIASIPTDTTLQFLIKLLPNGVASHFFNSCQIHDTFSITEAKGRFTAILDTKEHLFIATGAGIAPILSMIRHELETKKTTNNLVLYFGLRDTKDVFWEDVLKKLEKAYPNFTCHITLSLPSHEWSGLTGRVTAHISQNHRSYTTYLCGSVEMVTEVRKLLLSIGYSKKNIHFEIF